MGGGCSTEPDVEVTGQLRSALKIANELGLVGADVYEMFRKFRIIEFDHIGKVNILEFLKLCNITNTTFAQIALSPFDSGKTGVFDFEEFLLSCWNLLAATETNLAKFVFELFDVDRCGYLTVIELRELIKIICGGIESDSYQYLNLELKRSKFKEDDYITFETFFEYVVQDPVLLLPVWESRDRLRKETLGDKRWLQITQQKSIDFGVKTLPSIIRDLRSKPACYRSKSFSFFHTGLIARTARAVTVASDSALRRERERTKRGWYKSVDLRTAETYLDKIASSSRSVVRCSSMGCVCGARIGMGSRPGFLGVNYSSRLPVLFESNPLRVRGDRHRDARDVPSVNTMNARERDTETEARLERIEKDERDFQIECLRFMVRSTVNTEHTDSELDGYTTCRTTCRMKSIGLSGEGMTGGIFEVINLDTPYLGPCSFKKGVAAAPEGDLHMRSPLLIKPR